MQKAKGQVRLKIQECLNDTTQKEFAEKIGMSENAITVLKRSSQINFNTLALLIEGTGKPIGELLEYVPPVDQPQD